jgi:hypothetical protein
VRAAALLVLVAAIACAACGPTSPTQAGGSEVDPVALLDVLPSPGSLRGEPAAAADADALQVALTGAPEPAVAARVRERAPEAAAVRSWSAPDGGELVAAVSVWDSHLIATGIGGDAAEQLLSQDGARAWTPDGLPGSRGARVNAAGRREERLSFAVGPNSLYVRAEGPVPADVVARTLRRLVLTAEGQQ